MLKCLICKMEVTRVQIAEDGWNTVQEAWFGRGNVVLKSERKS